MRPQSLNDDAPIDEVDEQLVAYLDGELSPEEIQLLERRLGSEPTLRARLRELQDGWEMLDQLPMATPSGALLETTLRLAAVQSETPRDGQPARKRFSSIRGVGLTIAAALLFFGLGVAVTRAREYLAYRKQLRELPLAMHLDAFLRVSDLQLVESVASMPQWQQANEIADRLGQWDFHVAAELDPLSPRERERLLPQLSLEDQQTVAAAWDRFERLDDQQRETVQRVANAVAAHPQSERLVKTMDRFASWLETLPADERDTINKGTDAERQAVILAALDRTTKAWTRQRSRDLSDEEVETIYQAVRQVARLRLKALQDNASPEIRNAISNFGSSTQAMNPQMEAFFLRRLFEGREFESGQFGPPMPLGVRGEADAFRIVRTIAEKTRGPLRNDELYLIESVLPQKLADDIHATADVPTLREELLRSLADESLRRIQFNRVGQSSIERYNAIDPDRREEIDLMPADRMLRELREAGYRRP